MNEAMISLPSWCQKSSLVSLTSNPIGKSKAIVRADIGTLPLAVRNIKRYSYLFRNGLDTVGGGVSQCLVEYGEKYNENPLPEKRNHRNMIASNCLITEN